MKKIFILASLGFFPFLNWAQVSQTVVSEESSIEVTSKKFNGTFSNINGNVDLNDKNQVTAVTIKVGAADVDVKSKVQKQHLLSEKWLNTEAFTEISFESSTVAQNEDGTYHVTGTMTIMGNKQEVAAVVTHSEADGYTGSFPIQRKDYQVGPDGNAVEEVLVTFKIHTGEQ